MKGHIFGIPLAMILLVLAIVGPILAMTLWIKSDVQEMRQMLEVAPPPSVDTVPMSPVASESGEAVSEDENAEPTLTPEPTKKPKPTKAPEVTPEAE